MYEKEIYSLNIENEKNLLRSTNYIKNNIILSKNINLTNTCYFQIATTDFNDFRFLYDGKINFYMNESFAFTLEFNYRYDNAPHGDIGSRYVQILNGINYSF